MPRTARLDLPDLLQHVIVRGVDGCDIFRDDDDRLRFLKRFSKLLLETDTECFAWSLMTNHFHLLLRPMDITEIVVRVCRYVGIEPEELRLKSRTARLVAARNLICFLAARQTGHNGVEVGKHVNLSRAGVSVAAGRGADMAKKKPELLTLLNN